MKDLELKIFTLGELDVNSYLLFDKDTKKGFLIDAPSEVNMIKDFLQKKKIDISFILLTHAHFDHIEGLNDLSQPFYMHEKDFPLLENSRLNCSYFVNGPFITTKKPVFLKEGEVVFDNFFALEIIHTPGHTPGSVSFKLGQWLFSGDTIFLNSIGRTDIPLGDYDLLIKSIKEKILILPQDIIIYPGHGPSTTVREEKNSNAYLV